MFRVGQYVYVEPEKVGEKDLDREVGVIVEVKPFTWNRPGQRVIVWYDKIGDHDVTVAWDSRVLVLV